MVRLFIENEEIELDKSVEFSITKEFEELSNPTIIINDWSKSVEIPATKINNKIFGHIYSPDKVIDDGSGVVTGIYFDPTKKLDFRLEWDGIVLMIGYAKMVDIKQVSGKTIYNITLNGELGKVFQEMKKITFDNNTTDTDYLINGAEYVSETMNKTLVANSFNNVGQSTYDLKKKGTAGYRVHDIIGFAPNNSYVDDFDYTTFQTGASTSETFANVLGDGFKTATGIDASTVIGDGQLPREIGEYRSYLQLPFIFFNKLFKIFKEKAEAVTGYSFDMTSNWFNNANPYWSKLVFMLKKLGNDKNRTYSNTYNNTEINTVYDLKGGLTTYKYHYDFNKTIEMLYTAGTEQIPLFNAATNTFLPYSNPSYGNASILNYNIIVRSILNRNFQSDTTVNLNVNVGLVIEFWAAKSDSSTVQLAKILLKDSETTISTSGYTHLYNWPRATIRTQGSIIGIDVPNIPISIPTSLLESSYKFYTRMYAIDNTGASIVNVFSYETSRGTFASVDIGNLYYVIQPATYSISVTPYSAKSNCKFTLNDLWDNEYNLFTEILNYCKMYRIGIFCDTYNKKIIFKPLVEYFGDYSILDYTDKLDKSKDYIIKPITLENKYTLFNYDDSDTKIGQEYATLYGLKYGEYKVITDYNFNTETTELFEGVKQPIINTGNYLSWNNLYANIIKYSVPNEYYVHCADDDNKFVSPFGTFYFHKGTKDFDTDPGLNMRSVVISDDTSFQTNNNTFFYSQDQDRTSVTKYPYLSNFMQLENECYGYCSFGTPKSTYSTEGIPYNTYDLYMYFWKNYFYERYNIQNKILTCYLKLKPQDYTKFAFNKFITIENQLYMINKIYDYNVTSNASTKVDLITIQDINRYTMNFHNLYLNVTANSTVANNTGSDVSINVSTNWGVPNISIPSEISNYCTVTTTKISDNTYNIQMHLNTKVPGDIKYYNLIFSVDVDGVQFLQRTVQISLEYTYYVNWVSGDRTVNVGGAPALFTVETNCTDVAFDMSGNVSGNNGYYRWFAAEKVSQEQVGDKLRKTFKLWYKGYDGSLNGTYANLRFIGIENGVDKINVTINDKLSLLAETSDSIYVVWGETSTTPKAFGGLARTGYGWENPLYIKTTGHWEATKYKTLYGSVNYHTDPSPAEGTDNGRLFYAQDSITYTDNMICVYMKFRNDNGSEFIYTLFYGDGPSQRIL